MSRRRRPQAVHLQTTLLQLSVQLCSSLFQPAHSTSRQEVYQNLLSRVQSYEGHPHGFPSDNLCDHHVYIQLHVHKGYCSGHLLQLLGVHIRCLSLKNRIYSDLQPAQRGYFNSLNPNRNTYYLPRLLIMNCCLQCKLLFMSAFARVL